MRRTDEYAAMTKDECNTADERFPTVSTAGYSEMHKSHLLKTAFFLIIPVVTAATPTEAADTYAIISEKNLFRPDRAEWVIDKPADTKMMDKKVDIDKLSLYGTIIIGDKKSALIHDKKAKKKDKKSELYSLGDYIGGYVLAAIDEKRVVLDYYGEKETLYLHEGKEPPKDIPPPPPPPEEKPKPKTAIKKVKEKDKNKMKKSLAAGKIPEALAKSPFMSEDNMKKILEFNKEIMEEMKGTGGNLDQEAMKEKVEQFRERFMDEMGNMGK